GGRWTASARHAVDLHPVQAALRALPLRFAAAGLPVADPPRRRPHRHGDPLGGRVTGRIVGALLTAALACLCVACGGAPPQPSYLLWRVDGPGSHVYLPGSVHFPRAGDKPAS